MSLSIKNVTKRFHDTVAVDRLSLEIPNQQIFGFLGANGAGKTTTIRMILGLLSPTEGGILLDGKKIDYSNSNEVGYLPEERGLYPKLSVKEQIIYLGKLRGMTRSEVLKELEYWLDRFHIKDYLNKKVEELSKGNQQKIQFIASMIHRPKLLFLDEPFSGLDPVNVELLKDVIFELEKRGTTIVFSSHRMEHVEELCENICIMHHGRPIVKGGLREVKRSFGKKNLIIHTEATLDEIRNMQGVVQMKKIAQGYVIQINDEEVSQEILKAIANKGFISKFVLEEPSLNDIFIEKVGKSYE